MDKYMEDVISLQKGYAKLLAGGKVTKKAICNLVIPFRDKYKLSDLEALQVARDEVGIEEIYKLYKEEREEK